MLFTGLFIGGIRIILKKQNVKLDKKNIFIPIVVTIITILLILLLKDQKLVIKNEVLNSLVMGVITALSIFIPGISAFSCRISNGYKLVLNLFKNISSFNSILSLVIFVVVALALTICFSKVVKCVMTKNKNITYIILCSLILSSVILLIVQIKSFNFNFVTIFTSMLAFLWGFLFAKNVERE